MKKDQKTPKAKTQTELTVITKGPNGIVENVIPFCIPEGEAFEAVSYASTMLATPSDLIKALSDEVRELRQQDDSRTRLIVRKFGYSAIFVALVAIGLGSYLVHAENIDMVKIDAIYNRISAVEASPYNVGDVVCFKLLDTETSKDKTRVIASLRFEGGGKGWPGLNGDYIISRGEILDHYQTEMGDWYAKVAVAGIFTRADKTKFVEVKNAVVVSLPEVRLGMALKQNKF